MSTSTTVPPPAHRPRMTPLGERPTLTASQVLALEAFADTIIPGQQRHDNDRAVVGVSDTPGAVECGALDVLTDPATGIEDGVGEMAELLDARAREFAAHRDLEVTCFADLDYPLRRTLVARLTGTAESQKDLWFLLALFSTMAYDSAPHLETAEALDPSRTPVSGLREMGFRAPIAGRWVFPHSSYERPLAPLHPGTTPNGDPT